MTRRLPCSGCSHGCRRTTRAPPARLPQTTRSQVPHASGRSRRLWRCLATSSRSRRTSHKFPRTRATAIGSAWASSCREHSARRQASRPSTHSSATSRTRRMPGPPPRWTPPKTAASHGSQRRSSRPTMTPAPCTCGCWSSLTPQVCSGASSTMPCAATGRLTAPATLQQPLRQHAPSRRSCCPAGATPSRERDRSRAAMHPRMPRSCRTAQY